ncbi:MAG: hypothetical protein ACK4GN_15190, partial [Runella sp.]
MKSTIKILAFAFLPLVVSAQVTTNKNVTTIAKGGASILAQQTIQLEDFNEWLCPSQLLRGDREFGGNGPKVKCEVKLRIGDNGSSLIADFYLWAQETKHDWSTTEGRWTRKVYEAPYGKRITKILSATASRTQFISPAAGFQFLVPGADVQSAMRTFFDGSVIENAIFAAHGIPNPGAANRAAISGLVSTYMQGNTVVKIPATEGTLVKFFHIVGDTGGDDISTDDNCNDD